MHDFHNGRKSEVALVARERDGLKNDLNLITVKNQLEEKAIKEQYALQLRDRGGEIERLRDMKARLSTKMVGESLIFFKWFDPDLRRAP